MSDYDQEQIQRLEPIYLEHYGLNEAPFASTLDDRFFYATTELTQQRNMLVHMTQYSDMLLLVIGEEGMGKTSLLHSYIKAAQDNWHVCRIGANGMLDEEQLLFKIAEDFRIETLPDSSIELQELLYEKLTRLQQNDILPVVIIDEAHTLPAESLEQILYLAEIKTKDNTPLMHFVLFAEPEVEATLQSLDTYRLYEQNCHSIPLRPFSEEETAEYIRHRLTVAGLQGESPFTDKTIRKLHKQTNGIPAHINELAHVVLDEGVARIGHEPSDEETDMENKPRIRPLRIAAGLAALGIVAVVLWQQEHINRFFSPDKQQTKVARPKPSTIPAAPEESPFVLDEKRHMAIGPMATETADAARQETKPQAKNNTVDQPLIIRVVPDTIKAGSTQQTLTLQGRHFGPQSRLSLSRPGYAGALEGHLFKVESETRIKFHITPGDKTQQWQVTVHDPQRGRSNTVAFQVTSPPAAPAAKKEAQPKPQQPDWVASQPRQNLTLQLLASRQRQALERFVQQHRLADDTSIYKTRHANKDWYVLLYGSYKDRQQAKDVMAQLPDKVKANKPWIRSFASFQATNTSKPETLRAKAESKDEQDMATHKAWLQSQDPAHFTVQLLGTQNEQKLEQFIQTYELRGKVVYFRTRRNDHDWFALLYGAYPDDRQAKQAVKDLPQALQGLTPWVRNFSAIQAELDTGPSP